MSGLIRCLDHIIVAVRDRRGWIPDIQRVLALEPGRMLEGAGEGYNSFSNAEFAIGDGFLGVVEPAHDTAQLHRFLDRFGDGFYAMSIDVGDVPAALAHWEEVGAHPRTASTGLGLSWLGPRETHGVVYQVIDGMPLGPGTNPRYLGVSTMTVAVADLDRAVTDYRSLFRFGAPQHVVDEQLGYRGAVLGIDGSVLHDTIVLAQPSDHDGELGRHLAARGEGIFSFGIAVSDLPGELDRLRGLGVTVASGTGSLGRRALLDPSALRGLRVELLDHP
jgi:Glyoxalase/Bleomycin resistance protein/Dioxygenase superfamily